MKDRDALFDLNQQNSSQTTNNNLLSSAQLVFVEAEQMVVVRTDFGWRPLQLLPTLIDFRKTIAKFSISTEDQRRQLMSADDSVGDKSIQTGRPGNRRVTPAKVAGSRSRSNDIINSDDDFTIDDGDDDDDGTEDDVYEDRDDEDDEDEDEDDDDEDDDEFDDDLDENKSNRALNPLIQSNNEQVAKLSVAQTTAPRRSLVAARSAASALVSASIDNSLSHASSSAERAARPSIGIERNGVDANGGAQMKVGVDEEPAR